MNRTIEQWYEENRTEVEDLADAIHDRPELSGQEYFFACKKTCEFLEKHGFQTDLYRIPPAAEYNCVVGRWGFGHPVIAILGEYDALPGLGQESVPYCAPVPGPGARLRPQPDGSRVRLGRCGRKRSHKGGREERNDSVLWLSR